MHRPALVVAIILQTRAFQRPPRHVQSLAPVRAAAADDVNALMTQLNAAVQQEDFRKAAELKKKLEAINGGATTKSGDWASRGAPGWLQARLQDLGMRFPTPVQEAALDAVDGSTDVVVSAPTGSGKTLAFLAPLLAVLDTKLAERERTQLDAGSNLGLLTPQAAMATFSPALWTSAQNLEGFRPPRFGDPRGAPLALVLCPSRALALQLGTACFTIVGGTNRNQGSYFPGDASSLFAYKGPKGCRVAALASDADLDRAVAAAKERRIVVEKTDDFGYDDYGGTFTPSSTLPDDLADCDVLVADAATLRDALKEAPDLMDTSHIKLVCVDEADACGDVSADILETLGLAKVPRVLVGATLTDASSLLRNGTATKATESGTEPFSLTQEKIRTPSSVRHEFLDVPEWKRPLILARCLRRDLREWEESGQGPRPRAVVFAANETSADALARQLRTSLWGAHAVAALLPTEGGSPTVAAGSMARASATDDSFAEVAARDGATVLVTVPSAARGLDFPNVSHVYRVGDVTEGGPATYAHVAGRAGRVGQASRGTCTSVGDDADFDALREMLDAFDGVDLVRAELPPSIADERPAGVTNSAFLERVFQKDVDDS
ncbi:unnamed protein product [Pelagomonas calceolata]|uniref:ATP-dependent RNA helicase n=1 Tax=Pelagomonas calceolata TaxID=35677 RepID=A0A8J2WZ40_9STRA|nr:unnamed protein product [Pelagomonas calceolata]|mmetsp:Transcript_9509/g.27904  ORF Transcript_9509/g.27904 Transcript_9509/m.27904 type:complete len:609 (+) Transcript_9509:1304-3130(+)